MTQHYAATAAVDGGPSSPSDPRAAHGASAQRALPATAFALFATLSATLAVFAAFESGGVAAASAAVGAVVVAAAGCVVALRRLRAPARSARRAAREFEAFFATAPEPAALTDADGWLIAANAAAGGHDPDGADRRPVAALLSGHVDDPAAVVYRVLSAAAASGAAEEVASGPNGAAMIGARSMRDGAVLWTIARAAAPTRLSSGADLVLESLPIAVARLSVDGVVLSANAAARMLLGTAMRPGVALADVIEGLGRPISVRIAEAERGDSSGRPEIARGEADGREVFAQVSLTRTEIDGGAFLFAVMADATELKTLEAQFVQSQKMQAVGQLAGGVAHDFNNLLTAIAGHTDLMLQRHEHGDLDYADLTQVRQNANRAAGLVRQLLAFSRKQTLRPTVVNLVDTLTETSHLLNRLLGERVRLAIAHAENLGLVKVDERQFEQVIMNLAVNARDAMPNGGSVSIVTANTRIDAEQRHGRAVVPKGDYVLIEIMDEGTGIPADKIDQIFEPFFTTKRAGEGTGLGLSTVYGIVKQTGGFIFARNRVEGGAVFSIYLPRYYPAQGEAAPSVAPISQPTDLTGRGVVMLIEDETPVRAFAARALKLRGYQVVEAASGEEALEILADPDLAIDVIVSDVVMPGMDGPACVMEARKMRPDVKVVFVSGYAEDSLRRSIDGVGECMFLPKPFSLNELTAKVKECVSS